MEAEKKLWNQMKQHFCVAWHDQPKKKTLNTHNGGEAREKYGIPFNILGGQEMLEDHGLYFNLKKCLFIVPTY